MVFRMSLAGIGDTARITRLRDGEADEIDVPMIAAPEVPPRNPIRTGERAALPEIVLSTINPAVIDAYGLPLMAEGVIVDDPGPYGARAGLRPGDILREINGIAVSDSATAVEALELASRTLSIEVMRNGRRMALRLRL
jgi:S1-C subfamily serine protease